MSGRGQHGDASKSQGFQYVPDDVRPSAFPRLDQAVLDALASIASLASTVADVLDGLGLALAVDASVLMPRVAAGNVVGHAITIRYLPSRMAKGREVVSGLATAIALETAEDGDVLVVDAGLAPGCSTFGGNAADSAVRAGVRGVVVDGAIRDVGEIRDTGLPVWSRAVTPRTGRWGLEAIAINGPIGCGGVQVRAGDLVCADETGICFVPAEVMHEVAERSLAASGPWAGTRARFERGSPG